MNVLRVKKWDEFQHYKDRDPVWIKLHTRLLMDYSFAQLSDAAKGQLCGIWLLASKSDGVVPHDAKWISSKINASERLRLDEIIAAGFLIAEQVASDALAEPERDASPRALAERRGEKRREETETEAAREHASLDLSAIFEGLWSRYPRRVGKKAAERHFRASVKTAEDVAAITLALAKYIRHCDTLSDAKYIQHGSTWFNNWRDWLDESAVPVKPPVSPDGIAMPKRTPREEFLDAADALSATCGTRGEYRSRFEQKFGASPEVAQSYIDSEESTRMAWPEWLAAQQEGVTQ